MVTTQVDLLWVNSHFNEAIANPVSRSRVQSRRTKPLFPALPDRLLQDTVRHSVREKSATEYLTILAPATLKPAVQPFHSFSFQL